MNKRYHGKRHATGKFSRWSNTANRHYFPYIQSLENGTYWGTYTDGAFLRWFNYLRELAFKAAHQLKTQCSKVANIVRLAFREESKLNRVAYLKLIASKYE